VDGLVGYHNFEGYKMKYVTPYPFLLFVPNMQSMKVDIQPRPSLLSWFKNLSVSLQSRVQFCPISVYLFMVSWDYFWLLWLSKVSDRVAIEKSVGSQLAVPMSLDFRRNSYTRLLFQENYCFKILLAY